MITLLRTCQTRRTIFSAIYAVVGCTAIAYPNPPAGACTIVSGVAEDGQAWTANNEDGPDGVSSYINVFPSDQSDVYGYFTLSSGSPAAGEDERIQGGMNEAGLTFDFNALNRELVVKGRFRKKPFPSGDRAILRHILGTMNSTRQVVEFFQTYWFERGFTMAQMHVADRTGCFAIISPSGSVIAEAGAPLISTNFDIVGKEDGSTCWRHPLATGKLKQHGAGEAMMVEICRETAQTGESFTLYSNVQNLTTGDVLFFANRDFDAPLRTNISDMLSKGRKHYSFDELPALVRDAPIDTAEAERAVKPRRVEVPPATVEAYLGSYRLPFGGVLKVAPHKEGIEVSGDGIPAEVLFSQSTNTFFSSTNDVTLTFEAGKQGAPMRLILHEGGNRAFAAEKADP